MRLFSRHHNMSMFLMKLWFVFLFFRYRSPLVLNTEGVLDPRNAFVYTGINSITQSVWSGHDVEESKLTWKKAKIFNASLKAPWRPTQTL